MTPCALPFCNCKARNRYYWWFCSRHWPLVGKRARKRLRAVTRSYHEAACANRIPVSLADRFDRALADAALDAIDGAHFV
ncbi:MAG: hypothetical protein GYB49_09305 [Alphaproteobacteria bacterium]|nr:hypothetical protein [Alphaproteobacteria bacterium]